MTYGSHLLSPDLQHLRQRIEAPTDWAVHQGGVFVSFNECESLILALDALNAVVEWRKVELAVGESAAAHYKDYREVVDNLRRIAERANGDEPTKTD